MLSAFTETWHRGRRGAALVWVVAGRAIFGPLPDSQAGDVHLLPAAPFSFGRKELGTDGDERRHHLQTWMAQLDPKVAAPRVGAGQDVASESFGKGSLLEPGWMRENAKALRASTLPE